MISVILPAYNEASVIGRTLSSVIASAQRAASELAPKLAPEGSPPLPPEIIVVCNGCRDDTADIARQFAPVVQTIELEEGSKIAALNAGDAAATLFPRFYLDADIKLSPGALTAVSRRLLGGEIDAAAPPMRCEMDQASRIVRGFYRTWLSRPYHRTGHVGSGFVGISRRGREQFDDFPNIIADDEFLRRQVAPDRREVIDDESFVIRVPGNLSSLIKVKTRSRLGTLQLNDQFPQLRANARCDRGALGESDPGQSPALWEKAAYGLIVLAVRLRARRQFKQQRFDLWERDETSRQAVQCENSTGV